MLLLFYHLIFIATQVVYPPCPSKISVASINRDSDGGKIEISVIADGKYVCRLNTENGAGLIKQAERTGSGLSKIQFNKLSIEQIYLIEVEFLEEESSSRCRKLQISQIEIK